MSSTCNSESDVEFGNDWLHRPIKTRSYYNSRFSSEVLLRQKSVPLVIKKARSSYSPRDFIPLAASTYASPSLFASVGPLHKPRHSLLPTPMSSSLVHSVGVIPPSSTSDKSAARDSGGNGIMEGMKSLARSRVVPLSAAESRPYRKCLEISNQDIGAILGRAGSTVSRIERQYNVAIYLDRQRLLLVVRGSLPVQVDDALADICQIITDNKNRAGRSSVTPQMAKQPAVSWRSTTFRGQSDNLQVDAEASAAGKCSFTEFSVKYRETPEVSALSESAVLSLRAANHINLACTSREGLGFCCPKPIWLFEQAFAQYDNNWAYLLSQRFARPSAIQAQGWPIILQGHDLIGVAGSQTGKTLTYVLPAALHTLRQMQMEPHLDTAVPKVLVLVPTEESAIQVNTEMKNFNNGQIRSLLLLDGVVEHYSQSDYSVHWIIGHPSRIADALDAKVLDLSNVGFLIVDGGDIFLESGLETQLYRIAQSTRQERQTVIMSIGWHPGVHRMASRISWRSVLLCIGPQPEPSGIGTIETSCIVRQLVCVVQDYEKLSKLIAFLGQMTLYDRAIIFCSTKERASDLSFQLTKHKLSNTCLHGQVENEKRWQVLNDINQGFVRILIATDPVSHALNVQDVTHVINYDFPSDIADYVVRIDRTGRSGRIGNCISYMTANDSAKASKLIAILEAGMHDVPLELRQMAQRFSSSYQKLRTMSASNWFGRLNSTEGRGPYLTAD